MTNDTQFVKTLQDWSEIFMSHSFREFRQFMDMNGLSSSQVITLFRLYHGGPCDVSTISLNLGITNAASSQLIDRLVALGLIERKENQTDRRAKQLTITNQGITVLEQGIAARRKWLEELTTQLTPDQQATVIAALAVLTKCAANLELNHKVFT